SGIAAVAPHKSCNLRAGHKKRSRHWPSRASCIRAKLHECRVRSLPEPSRRETRQSLQSLPRSPRRCRVLPCNNGRSACNGNAGRLDTRVRTCYFFSSRQGKFPVSVSIIIPTLSEESCLAQTLE